MAWSYCAGTLLLPCFSIAAKPQQLQLKPQVKTYVSFQRLAVATILIWIVLSALDVDVHVGSDSQLLGISGDIFGNDVQTTAHTNLSSENAY